MINRRAYRWMWLIMKTKDINENNLKEESRKGTDGYISIYSFCSVL